ncbi:MAG: imidazole glycerol phosphate synthase subunit HisH [Bacteroidetes bacterium]|nr:MAG: imidazole glycerol phosphate synthase subunit HisH [Bacteroidota bacterium]
MIGIVDYHLNNLRSVQKAFEKAGAPSFISDDPDRLRAAERLVLPGVGAFGSAMKNLEELGLRSVLDGHVRAGRPLLGICLGMQLLFTRSSEHGEHAGLDYIAGDVTAFPTSVKVPHMGWNQVEWTAPTAMAEGVPAGSFVYFVHSYVVRPRGAETVAVTEYAGRFTSVVQRGNIVGIQFHPEKSQAAGLRLLKNFAALA